MAKAEPRGAPIAKANKLAVRLTPSERPTISRNSLSKMADKAGSHLKGFGKVIHSALLSHVRVRAKSPRSALSQNRYCLRRRMRPGSRLSRIAGTLTPQPSPTSATSPNIRTVFIRPKPIRTTWRRLLWACAEFALRELHRADRRHLVDPFLNCFELHPQIRSKSLSFARRTHINRHLVTGEAGRRSWADLSRPVAALQHFHRHVGGRARATRSAGTTGKIERSDSTPVKPRPGAPGQASPRARRTR